MLGIENGNVSERKLTLPFILGIIKVGVTH